MKICYFKIGLALFLFILTGCGAEQNLKKGEEHLALGEYFDAATQFKQAYQKTPIKERDRRGMIANRMALCYEKINLTQKTIAAYHNAGRYHKLTDNEQLRLGRLLLKNGQYKEAEKLFITLQAEHNSDSLLIANGLMSARMAPQWKKAGSRYEVKKMTVFNSRRAEYSPMLMGDQSEYLYFTSTRDEAQGANNNGITGTKSGDIFRSEKDNKGNWKKPVPAEGELNTAFDEGVCAFSPDQRTMYLTQCAVDPEYPRSAQLMTATRQDAQWSKATKLEISRDTLSSFAHPAVSPDGKWLYFTSDMPGGMGGLDIWRVRITESGLGGIENPGAPINTPGNEAFPTFRPNGDLYFSSDGHPGMGGLDIFIARYDNARQRYKIIHPGYPLNSMADDFGMTFEGFKNKGFFASNRTDSHGWDHLYAFENPEIIQTIKGWVYEMDGYELTEAQVYLVGNDGTNVKIAVKGDGSFTQEVQPGVDYVMLATCKGYLNHKEEIHIETSKESEEHVLQFPLASITAPVLIDNIFYDLNKATLRPESSQALDKLVQLLNDNPHVAIELGAHCDYRGTTEYNLQLSQRRAESVINYLIEKGIEKQRLVAKGYGKGVPKSVNRKLSEKYEWLQTGEKLTESFIAKQLKDNQEICNQLNRRTEFRVIKTTYGLLDKDGKLLNKPQRPSKKQNENPDDELFLIQ